jgi:hypothetical protein
MELNIPAGSGKSERIVDESVADAVDACGANRPGGGVEEADTSGMVTSTNCS